MARVATLKNDDARIARGYRAPLHRCQLWLAIANRDRVAVPDERDTDRDEHTAPDAVDRAAQPAGDRPAARAHARRRAARDEAGRGQVDIRRAAAPETSRGAGLPLWIYGPVALEWSGQGTDAPLYAIHVIRPFAGRTVEGLGLGDDRDTLRRIYSSYPIVSNPTSLRVVDSVGISLLAFFDDGGRISAMELYVGDPLSGH